MREQGRFCSIALGSVRSEFRFFSRFPNLFEILSLTTTQYLCITPPPSPLPGEGVCRELVLVDAQTKVSQRRIRSFRGVVGPGPAQKAL